MPARGFGFRWGFGSQRRALLFAPVNTVLPAIPTGTATVGSTLTSPNTGTWTGSPTITYARQWFRADPVYDGLGAPVLDGNGDPVYTNAADIAGETGSTYVLGSSDAGQVVGVRVIATNGGGSTSASSPVRAIAAAGGTMNFQDANNSGLLAALEDI